MGKELYTFQRLKGVLSGEPFTEEELERIEQDLVDVANKKPRSGVLSGEPFTEEELERIEQDLVDVANKKPRSGVLPRNSSVGENQELRNKKWKSAVEQRLPPGDRGEEEE